MLNIKYFFQFQIIPNFYPAQSERIRNGIFVSLKQILDKRVLSSLVPLFTNSRIDGELRAMIQNTFREFCVPPAVQGNIFFLFIIELVKTVIVNLLVYRTFIISKSIYFFGKYKTWNSNILYCYFFTSIIFIGESDIFIFT